MSLVIAATFVAAAAAVLNVTLVITLAERFGTEGQEAGIIGAVPTAA
ncbi:hypothetical protein [Methylobacterium dankookense]|uniref:Uncharacterized protein n=1 Tax=Methylobacterium dankookense TaxID=560405 RepID=A0A564FSE7_9HYPH|nr:hypothetical protein [Methylobacterium dankookense]GJD58560.1 hypothetical protein IFDJLNFL_4481 [Methylobacterium dankookense]VUF10897.1 hypothetical protein MTDSW087_00569 [Methylobacterium dankookense]